MILVEFGAAPRHCYQKYQLLVVYVGTSQVPSGIDHRFVERPTSIFWAVTARDEYLV